MKVLETILDYVGKIALIIFITATSLLTITGALFIKVIDWGKEIL